MVAHPDLFLSPLENEPSLLEQETRKKKGSPPPRRLETNACFYLFRSSGLGSEEENVCWTAGKLELWVFKLSLGC